jgi:hypothetical protein
MPFHANSKVAHILHYSLHTAKALTPGSPGRFMQAVKPIDLIRNESVGFFSLCSGSSDPTLCVSATALRFLGLG